MYWWYVSKLVEDLESELLLSEARLSCGYGVMDSQ
jgi:hypothetical protein